MQENIKEIVKAEYEAGSGAKELADKYKIKAATIRSWANRENWNKEKQVNKRNTKKNYTLQHNATQRNEKKNNVAGLTKKKEKNIVEEIIKEEEKSIKTGVERSKFKRLTEKEKEFVRNYFACKFNVRLATLKSGFKNYSYGLEVLRKGKIKKIIDRVKKTFVELDPLRIDANYLLEELTKNHLTANGTLKQKKATVVETSEKIPVVVDLDGKKVVKYKEIRGAEVFTYEEADTDIRASNQSLQLIAKLTGLEKPQTEENKGEKEIISLLQNITKQIDEEDSDDGL